MKKEKSKGYPGKAYPKTQKEKELMGRLTPLGAKIVAIRKAIKSGQKFYLHTYVGKAELIGIAGDGHFVMAKGRTWAIGSTQINYWYSQLGKEEKTMVDIGKLIRLRNLVLTAIDITLEDMKDHKPETPSHSYRLGMLHCQKDFKDKLNALIAMG